MKITAKFLCALTIASMGGIQSASAADYFVVVPIKGRGASDNIALALDGGSLPPAKLNQAYAPVDFKRFLRVTGDPKFTGNGVAWTIVQGQVPTGLSFYENGTMSGTPVERGTSSFRLRATYKMKQVETTYSLTTTGFTVNLDPYSAPRILVGSSYGFSLRPRLKIEGDTDYTGSDATFEVVSGSLPPGLSLSEAGMVFGTPTDSGPGYVVIRATYKGVSSPQQYFYFPAFSWEDDVPGALGTQGDGNGDGTLDRYQNNVHSAKAQTSTWADKHMTLEVEAPNILVDVVATPAPSGLPRNVKLPMGRFTYTIENVTPGGSVTANVYYPSETNINAHFEKTTSGNWTGIATGVTTVGTKTKVTFTLVDGGPYDADGLANGRISNVK